MEVETRYGYGASLLILCLHLAWVSCLQKVEQNPQSLKIQEGESITINCSYTETTNQQLQWFRQDPGQGLISLFYLTSGEKENGRLRSRYSMKERHSSLHIINAQPGDSAIYLCAVR
uniref:Ig-like domain-containing protein n=1 Tax=Sarcophilus harrisii TaxID=9305 RepID=G3WCQ5_SARHA